MRLAYKFAFSLGVVMVLVLALQTYVEIERFRTLSENEAKKDALQLGATLAATTRELWTKTSWETALAFLNRVEAERGADTRLRWVWLDGQDQKDYQPLVPDAATAVQTTPVTYDLRDRGVQLLVVYHPVPLSGLPRGAIEVSRSTKALDEHVRSMVAQELIGLVLALLLYALGALMVGRKVVGEPMARLVSHARRVGEGNFTIPTELTQRDEIGTLAIEMNDMTARLLAERKRVAKEKKARRAAEHQLRHANRLSSVGEMAASVAHDVATPLNVISGRAEMMASVSDRVVAKQAKIIEEAADRAAVILRRLLDYSRSGRSEIEAVDLEELAAATITMLESVAKKADVVLEHRPSGASVTVRADRGAIVQVVTNLIVNAIQAQPDGGRVTVQVDVDGTMAMLEVVDEGPGIPADIRATVFEPFYTTKGEGNGTGLGLSVCKTIVEEANGTIELDNAPGGGATFRVRLPIFVATE